MCKTVSVQPGEITQVILDGTEAVPIDLDFSYLGLPLAASSLSLQPTDFVDEVCQIGFDYRFSMGPTDSEGKKSLRVTPGTYQIIAQGVTGSPLWLMQRGQLDFSSAGLHSLVWDETNGGTLEVAPTYGVAEAETTFVTLDTSGFSMKGSNSIALDAGQHSVSKIIAYLNGTTYSFVPSEGGGILNLSAGQTASFAPDLAGAEAVLNVSNPTLTRGDDLNFDLSAPVTPSGYILSSFSSLTSSGDIVDILVSLKAPDGSVAASKTIRYDGSFIETGADWAAGTYTLEVTRNLGPLFDPIHLSASITIGTGEPDFDINDDGQISYPDLKAVAGSYEAETGEDGFDAAADLNQDGIINLFDLVLMARQLPANAGTTPPPPPPPDNGGSSGETTEPPPSGGTVTVPPPDGPPVEVEVDSGTLTETVDFSTGEESAIDNI